MVRGPIFQQALTVTTASWHELGRTTLRAAQLAPLPYLIIAQDDVSRGSHSVAESAAISTSFKELLRNVTSDLPIPYPGTGWRGRCLGHIKVSENVALQLFSAA
jgi:hypothetical protein